MAISRKRKEELVAQYKTLIGESKAIFLTDYSGMSVKDMQGLRTKVRDAEGSFYVTKNTLLKIALKESGTAVPDELLLGQVAVGFAQGETPSLAKAIVDFADDEEALKLKGGIMDGKVLSIEEVEALAKLPSLDELRAQILGLINAPAQNIVSVFASGVRQVVNVVDAYARSEATDAEVSAEAA